MISNKEEFLKAFLPDTVKEFEYTHINLDTTDLSISDVLRNLNKLYPMNSRARMQLEGGELALAVLCKTETVDPYGGVFILVSSKQLEISISSSNYIVLCISEDRIKTEKLIQDLMEEITSFLIMNYAKTMRNLPDFYRKFVYNETELYEDEYDPQGY